MDESKPEGTQRIEDPMSSTLSIRRGLSSASMSEARLAFLAKLPFFLNSSLKMQRVVQIALEHILEELQAELAVVFLKDGLGGLTFWSLTRQPRVRSEGEAEVNEHPSVSLVMQNSFPLVLHETAELKSLHLLDCFGMPLRNLICVPLRVRDKDCVGAFQIVNMSQSVAAEESSLTFCEQFGHQLALAVDNARLFQEAQEHRQQLVALDKKKSETISIIAHEFRTPLNIIQNAAELLTSTHLTEHNRNEMVTLLHNSVQRLTKLMSQIRNVSLVQDDELLIQREVFDLNALLQLVIERFKSVAENRSLHLAAYRPTSPVYVLAEPRLLSIVMQNLVANAIRFTPNGGSVILQLETSMNHAKVSVIDTGIGIAEEEQQLVFEKFYEVKDTMLHSSGEYEFQSSGLGLGLAAVKHILAAHNSYIQLRSTLGEGSCFSFSLELAAQAEAEGN